METVVESLLQIARILSMWHAFCYHLVLQSMGGGEDFAPIAVSVYLNHLCIIFLQATKQRV